MATNPTDPTHSHPQEEDQALIQDHDHAHSRAHDHSHGDHSHNHDDHGHSHDGHDHEHAGGVWGLISAVFHLHGHSHQHNALVTDTAFAANKEGIRTVWIALAALTITSIFQ